MNLPINDAARVRIIRAILGLTIREFARKVGVRPTTITDWEKGRSAPQLHMRNRLSAIVQENKLAFLPSGMPVPAVDCLMFKENKNA